MENVPVFVGLDYHTKSVQVCVMDAAGKVLANRSCGNSVLEIGAVIGTGTTVARAAIESCCGAADLTDALRRDLGWPLSMAHAGYVARMKCNPDKTDYGDAKMLAELSRAGLIPPVWLPPHNVRELRLLVRLRADLVGSVRAAKTRVLAVLRQQRIAEPREFGRWCKKWRAWLSGSSCTLSEQGRFAVQMYLDDLDSLKRRVAMVEAQLKAATTDDVIVAALRKIKGVGDVTAWTMRALIGRFDRFTSGKQLARFCAVTPRNASSGQRVADSGMIKAGDPQLKSVVIEAAQRLRRYEPRWRELSDAMAARGKPASVIIGAVANRWLRGLFHQMKELPLAA
jgi:transposase